MHSLRPNQATKCVINGLKLKRISNSQELHLSQQTPHKHGSISIWRSHVFWRASMCCSEWFPKFISFAVCLNHVYVYLCLFLVGRPKQLTETDGIDVTERKISSMQRHRNLWNRIPHSIVIIIQMLSKCFDSIRTLFFYFISCSVRFVCRSNFNS